MNKDEIIKALFKRNDTLCKDALDLITEQEKEIKRLKAENEYLDRTDEERYEEAEANIRAEIANGGTSCHWCEDTIRRKAVKEFAEKLKAKLFSVFRKTICSDFDTEDITIFIDELLKEYEK